MDPVGPSEGETPHDPGTSDHDAQVERLAQQLSLLLRRARRMMREAAGRIHPEIDAGAYAVLLVIAQAGPLRLVELAEELGLDKSTMSRQVWALLRLGLVERRPDPADGRAFLLELSPMGRERFAELNECRRRGWREKLAHWSTAEIAGLADGLERLGAEQPDPDQR
ncbi:MarR family winged helix-turn-helix transcriptional regulator [Pseudonocardia hispaniensis]|uniref:MarR family winged helix-turn-helix transcriptional regulator n=1 Tax=Pseudonocardia hispaniensis TaxID=904933 RepID=A0ABW1J4Z9_9PSEU